MGDLNRELVAATPYDMEPGDFSTALEQRQANRTQLIEWIKQSLVSGTDYGSIHVVGKNKCGLGPKNCNNPNHFSKLVLFKPGAEKVCGMLGVLPRFPSLTEYERAALQGVELRSVILHCELQSATGVVLADGIGARSLVQDAGDLNKCLKMAAKSAMIDACLRLGGLSELFTLDLEDLPPKDDEEPGEPVYMVNPEQLRRLAARLKGYDLPEERVLKWCSSQWGITRFEDLTHEQWRIVDTQLEKFAEKVKSERSKEPISSEQLRKVVSFSLQHTVDLTAILRKIGVNAIGELTPSSLEALWKALEERAERKAIQSDGSPVVHVEPGSEAERLLDRAKRIRTEAKYADGSAYYRDLEEAQNLEAAARKLLAEQKALESQEVAP